MRRTLLRLRPYAIAAAVGTILLVDLSNQWEVPIAGLPGEFYDRYVDTLDPADEPEVLLRLAEAGNVQAQYVYALRHTSYAPVSLQLPEDKDVAFRWTKQAAENGHSRAMAVLALYLYRGTATPKNLEEAEKWAEKATEKSQPMGFRVLGDIAKEKARMNKPAADRPDARQARVAYEEDMKKAYAYYKRGADAGERVSLRMLAEGYDEGVPGMPRNFEKATELLKRSAMRRDITAIEQLASRLEEGAKAPRDLSQAYCWRLVLAQLSGKPTDQEALDQLERLMRLAEIKSGQEAAAQILLELPTEAADALSRLHVAR